jgi:L-threonylcarbamoyladenylate synthase
VAPTSIDLRDPDADLEPFVRALLAGRTVVIPTDTVYGIACAAHLSDACERTVALKGRDLSRPAALLCASFDTVLTTVLPELHGRAAVRARRLLPGPVTVVVPNPARRFRWLCGPDTDRVGLRVPVLDERLAAAIDRVGALMATSANRTGEPDPRTLEEVPAELRERAAVLVDGGPARAGAPSTVVDLTRKQPSVLRQGALPSDELLARLA